MGIFHEPLAAFGQAHRIIWKLGGWRYLLVPVALTTVLAPLMIVGCYFGAGKIASSLAEWMSGGLAESTGWWAEKTRQLLDPSGWMTTLVAWTIFLLGLLPCYVLFRVIVMLLYGPFLDRLAIKAELLLRVAAAGHPPVVSEGSFMRMAVINILALGLSLVLMIVSFVVGFIPVVGFLAGLIIFFPLQMLLASLPLLDPAFERGGFSLPGSVGLTLKHFGQAVVFSSLCFVLMAVPLIGWFLGPTYAVVSGIVLGIRIRERVAKPARA